MSNQQYPRTGGVEFCNERRKSGCRDVIHHPHIIRPSSAQLQGNSTNARGLQSEGRSDNSLRHEMQVMAQKGIGSKVDRVN